AAASPLREARLGGAAGRDAVLHHGRVVRRDRARDPEGAMIPDAWRRDGSVVAVVGLGKSGVAATKLLAREGARVYASDASDHPYGGAAVAELRGLAGVEVDVGRHDLAKIRSAAGVVVSPGVPPDAAPLAAAREAGVPVVSEIDLGFRALVGSGTRCIAITGTNGKTTTTALVAHLLRGAALQAEAAGNIGRPRTGGGCCARCGGRPMAGATRRRGGCVWRRASWCRATSCASWGITTWPTRSPRRSPCGKRAWRWGRSPRGCARFARCRIGWSRCGR